jgi:hypothetical protein
LMQLQAYRLVLVVLNWHLTLQLLTLYLNK